MNPSNRREFLRSVGITAVAGGGLLPLATAAWGEKAGEALPRTGCGPWALGAHPSACRDHAPIIGVEPVAGMPGSVRVSVRVDRPGPPYRWLELYQGDGLLCRAEFSERGAVQPEFSIVVLAAGGRLRLNAQCSGHGLCQMEI